MTHKIAPEQPENWVSVEGNKEKTPIVESTFIPIDELLFDLKDSVEYLTYCQILISSGDTEIKGIPLWKRIADTENIISKIEIEIKSRTS